MARRTRAMSQGEAAWVKRVLIVIALALGYAGPVFGVSYSVNPNTPIPDNNATGVTSTINVPDSFTIDDVDLGLTVQHTWVGDLVVTLQHGATIVRVIDRARASGGAAGSCGSDDYSVTLDGGGTGGSIQTRCGANLTPKSPPKYTPANPLSAFDGLDAVGEWRLTVSDHVLNDVGVLQNWRLDLRPRVVPTGACCIGGACQTLTAAACTSAGGVFLGPNRDCTPTPPECAPTGGCCSGQIGIQTCSVLTAAQCAGLSSPTYLGDGIGCSGSVDCNENGQDDVCDIAAGTLAALGAREGSADPASNDASPETSVTQGNLARWGPPTRTLFLGMEQGHPNGAFGDRTSIPTNGVPQARNAGLGGPVLLGGDEAEDHCRLITVGNQLVCSTPNESGALYIQTGLDVLGQRVSAPGRTVVCIGCRNFQDPNVRAFDAFAKGFGATNLAANGWTRFLVNDGAVAGTVGSFLQDLGVPRLGSVGIIYISPAVSGIQTGGSGVAGGITGDELAALNANAVALRTFVENGGGLFVHHEFLLGENFEWLRTLYPGLGVNDCCCVPGAMLCADRSDCSLSPECDTSLLGLTDFGSALFGNLGSGLSAANGNLWFQWFSNTGGLSTIMEGEVGGDPRPVILFQEHYARRPVVTLAPRQAANPAFTPHVVTATVLNSEGMRFPGVPVRFAVTSGPNAGISGTQVTDVNGQASFLYIDTRGIGTDELLGSIPGDAEVPLFSNTVTKTWIGSADCNADGVPDECAIDACRFDHGCDDCNLNGVPDGCDIASGYSMDSDGDQVPDECLAFVFDINGGFCPGFEVNWSCTDAQGNPETFCCFKGCPSTSCCWDGLSPGQFPGAPGQDQTVLIPCDTFLDVDARVPSLRLLTPEQGQTGGAFPNGPVLRITSTDPQRGDLSFSPPGRMVLNGTVLLGGNRTIGVGDDTLTSSVAASGAGNSVPVILDIEAGSNLSGELGRVIPNNGLICAANVTIRGGTPGTDGGKLELGESMELFCQGDLTLIDEDDTRVDCAPSNTAELRLGAHTPPVVRVRDRARIRLANVSLPGGKGAAGFLATASQGADDIDIENMGTSTTMGGAALEIASTEPADVFGNWVNNSRYPGCFDALRGWIRINRFDPVLTRTTTFEVAGRNLGAQVEGFCPGSDTNFSVGRLELSPGSLVEFRNGAANCVPGDAGCPATSQALYVQALVVQPQTSASAGVAAQPRSKFKIGTNTFVYYRYLVGDKTAACQSGCTSLQPVPRSDLWPTRDPATCDFVAPNASCNVVDIDLVACCLDQLNRGPKVPAVPPVRLPVSDPCSAADYDLDGDVDLLDASAFIKRMTSFDTSK